MLANDRVITIAASSPPGETRVTSARSARGLSSRQVTAIVGCLAARIRSATVTASDVDAGPRDDHDGFAPGRRVIVRGRHQHRLGSQDELRERGGHHRSAQCLPSRSGDGLGQVVGGAGAGDDDAIGPGEELARVARPVARPRRARRRSPRPWSSSRARSAGRQGSVIGRAARPSSDSGRREPCFGRIRSGCRPGRRRSARPAAPARPGCWSSSAASSAVSRTGSNDSRARVGRQPIPRQQRVVQPDPVEVDGLEAREASGRQMARLDDERVRTRQPESAEGDELGARAGSPAPAAISASSAGLGPQLEHPGTRRQAVALDLAAERVEAADRVLEAGAGDIRPAPAPDLERPRRDQPAERLADGGPADPVALPSARARSRPGRPGRARPTGSGRAGRPRSGGRAGGPRRAPAVIP